MALAAALFAHRLAAIVPVCGGYDPKVAPKLVDLPCWAFHGAKDKVVPISLSRRMVQAINAAGGSARLTTIREGGHDVWSTTYGGKRVYKWMLSHRRS